MVAFRQSARRFIPLPSINKNGKSFRGIPVEFIIVRIIMYRNVSVIILRAFTKSVCAYSDVSASVGATKSLLNPHRRNSASKYQTTNLLNSFARRLHSVAVIERNLLSHFL
jgi:hypothetical protein